MAKKVTKNEKTYTYAEFRKHFLLDSDSEIGEEKDRKFIAARLAHETIRQFKELVSR
jgi:hypothetical protein